MKMRMKTRMWMMVCEEKINLYKDDFFTDFFHWWRKTKFCSFYTKIFSIWLWIRYQSNQFLVFFFNCHHHAINLIEFDTKVINFRFLIVVIKQNRSVGIRHHQVTNFGFFFIFHIFNQLINILDFFLKMAIMMELTANNNNNNNNNRKRKGKRKRKGGKKIKYFSHYQFTLCAPHTIIITATTITTIKKKKKKRTC